MRMGTSIEEQKVLSGVVPFEVYNKIHMVTNRKSQKLHIQT